MCTRILFLLGLFYFSQHPYLFNLAQALHRLQEVQILICHSNKRHQIIKWELESFMVFFFVFDLASNKVSSMLIMFFFSVYWWRWWGGGGGSTRQKFGYRWAAEALKPGPCLGQKIPKIHALLRRTPSILLPCLGRKTNVCRLVSHLLAIAISRANSR